MSDGESNRRDFLKTTVATGAALSLTAASFNRVYGANERIGIGFLGVGGRCQQHIDVILEMQKKGVKVAPVAVCDVWDGDPELGKKKGRGLYPSAKRCDIADDKKHVTKDYRTVLEQKDVNVVVVATPDHWHAKMCLDALEQGKDVYCEKPMTRTIAEAQAVTKAAQEHKRVMTVGVQPDGRPHLAGGLRAYSRRQDRQGDAGSDQLLPQFAGRPVALLPADQGDDPQDDRLGHVAGA